MSCPLAVFRRPPADPVGKNWPLMESPWAITLIVAGYLLFVLKLGKKFMENRQPYNLKNVIIMYNVFQVLYNATFVYFNVYYCYIKPIYDWRCLDAHPLDHPYKNIERYVSYAYFINKVSDLMDTVFFVLRKRYKQITVLHVYHHVMMVLSTYWVIRIYGYGGQYWIMTQFNAIVHVVMYLYYLISAMNPGLSGRWKKFITRLQLVQFVVLFMQSVLVLVLNPSCTFPKFLQYMQLFQATVMIVMFSNFYIQAYVKPKQKKL